jgi:aspartate/methionine/tyrosine aminotransferase
MKIQPFATENYYARYEFSTPHLLSVSDCETMSIGELLQMAGVSLEEMGQVRLSYTESQGNPVLREAVANTYDEVSAEDVVILTSPVEGIYLTLQAMLEPEDEAIVLVPAYDALINVAEHVSRHVHRWEIVPTEMGWELDLDALANLINSRTKLIVVNFPHNPTGYLPTRSQFEALIQLVEREGIWLFYDEMYRGLEYGERPQLPSAADSYERSIVLSGLSKTHGLPGLRAGWLVIPDEEVRQTIINWKHYTTICPAAPTEFLALAALSVGDKLAQRSQGIIQQNLQLAETFFTRWQDLFKWRPPLSGSVALVGIDVTSATSYCHHLAQEAGVLLLPATFMGSDDQHVRFGFGRRSFPSALSHYDAYLEKRT